MARGTLNGSLPGRFIVLEERFESFERTFTTAFKALAERFEDFMEERRQATRPNYVAMIAMGGVFIASMGIMVTLLLAGFAGFWAINTMKIEGTVHPLSEQVARNETKFGAYAPLLQDHAAQLAARLKENADSIRNRADLDVKVGQQDRQIASLQRDLAREQERNTEIETQFDLGWQNLNQQYAATQREFSIIHSHVPSLGPYPTGPFYFGNPSHKSRPPATLGETTQ